MAKIYDIRAKVGEYEKDGETKGRYMTIGAVLETKAGGQMIKLDVIPTNWDGVCYLNEPHEKDKPMPQSTVMGATKDIAPKYISDDPINLDSIPF